MRLYESVFIARQDITSAQAEAMADEFAEIMERAKIKSSELRKLVKSVLGD